MESKKKDNENNDLGRSSMKIRAVFRQKIDKTGTARPLSPAPSQFSRLEKAFTIPIYIWYPILQEVVIRLSSTSFYPASRCPCFFKTVKTENNVPDETNFFAFLPRDAG